MPVIHGATAPQFTLEGTLITGLASPSRGSTEISSWIVRLEPGIRVPGHILSKEEVFVVLKGSAVASIGEERYTISAGDALAVPPGLPFSLAIPQETAFEAVASMVAGGQGSMVDGDGSWFAPPWSV
jgi:quercetin dioxygenase-like cupin family protein